jgi:hypothetical protein
MLHHVPEFPNVAWPGMGGKIFQSVGGECDFSKSIFGAGLLQEEFRQFGISSRCSRNGGTHKVITLSR